MHDQIEIAHGMSDVRRDEVSETTKLASSLLEEKCLVWSIYCGRILGMEWFGVGVRGGS